MVVGNSIICYTHSSYSIFPMGKLSSHVKSMSVFSLLKIRNSFLSCIIVLFKLDKSILIPYATSFLISKSPFSSHVKSLFVIYLYTHICYDITRE